MRVRILTLLLIASPLCRAAGDESRESALPELLPEFAETLRPTAHPTTFDAGRLGRMFLTGVATGFGQLQTNTMPGDREGLADITNALLFMQKPEGALRFFVQGGIYALPALGTPYMTASKTTSAQWGSVPEAYVTLAANDDWSVSAGKLAAIPGYEDVFTYQNLNIERGLLWSQSGSVSRGLQVNHSAGPWSFALAWTDGFYSDRLTWISGSATWKINETESFIVLAGGNTRTTSVNTVATPVPQNNSRILNLIYSRRFGRWSVSPNVQYTEVPEAPSIGIQHEAATYGASLLVNYSFDPAASLGSLSLAGASLPLRLEYIESTGTAAEGAPNLLYGPGSAAWSLSLTPTYQRQEFFARVELSYVVAARTSPGLAFGSSGSALTQARLALEAGLLF